MSHLTPTPIVDKNGRKTTVHKKNNVAKPSSRIAAVSANPGGSKKTQVIGDFKISEVETDVFQVDSRFYGTTVGTITRRSNGTWDLRPEVAAEENPVINLGNASKKEAAETLEIIQRERAHESDDSAELSVQAFSRIEDALYDYNEGAATAQETIENLRRVTPGNTAVEQDVRKIMRDNDLSFRPDSEAALINIESLLGHVD